MLGLHNVAMALLRTWWDAQRDRGEAAAGADPRRFLNKHRQTPFQVRSPAPVESARAVRPLRRGCPIRGGRRALTQTGPARLRPGRSQRREAMLPRFAALQRGDRRARVHHPPRLQVALNAGYDQLAEKLHPLGDIDSMWTPGDLAKFAGTGNVPTLQVRCALARRAFSPLFRRAWTSAQRARRRRRQPSARAAHASREPPARRFARMRRCWWRAC